MPYGDKFEVIIVGAGVAGLAAGKTLLDNNISDFCILESNTCIGGRVHTINVDQNSTIDLGAHWIHGQDGNRAYDLIKELNLVTNDEDRFYDAGNSKLLSEGGSVQLSEPWEKLHSLLESFDTTCKNKSVGWVIDNIYSGLEENHGCTIEMKESLHNFISSVDGGSTYQTSITSWIDYGICPGSQLFALNSGYGEFYEKCLLSEQLKTKIMLNAPVTKITWDDTEDEHIHIDYGREKKVSCDYVICTVSLGVLKANWKSMFSPRLPQTNIKAIEGLGFGWVEKIFIRFEENWWSYISKCGFTFLHTSEDIEEAKQGKWENSILGFYSVPSAPGFLCGWITGRNARLMAMATTDELQSRCMSLIRKFVGTLADVPPPIDVIRSEWSVDPCFYGSYSYRSMDAEASGVSAEDLSLPIYDRKGSLKVMLAGEAAQSNFFSTVHGAVETGEREAKRVISNLK